ncbi:hypothetical protein WJX73_010711 [Symbiochloris irregularis]|uniref:Uncharacterized protein n=1 Tax=Symbiochloris irregularis TaxID=706552 RepID=A0AAW1NR22_9CHLO
MCSAAGLRSSVLLTAHHRSPAEVESAAVVGAALPVSCADGLQMSEVGRVWCPREIYSWLRAVTGLHHGRPQD